jgi:hypothetical protein
VVPPAVTASIHAWNSVSNARTKRSCQLAGTRPLTRPAVLTRAPALSDSSTVPSSQTTSPRMS